MQAPTPPIAVTSYRGTAVENTHLAHVAVVDSTGRIVYAFGDPHRLTLPRSAVKPAQALAVVETGALEHFGFDEADLALMCASHSSEAVHVERARAMLAKTGSSESDLRCGGHPPLSDAVWRDWIKRDFSPTPVCSNCSGKHAGVLAAAKGLGLQVAGYERDDHPLQQRVKHTLAALCDLPDEALAWGTDGCNLPTPSFPLDRLARLFAKLAAAADASAPPTADAPTAPHTAGLARIYRAMTTYPELVAGEGRFCTALMRAFGGMVLGKVGAEASYAIGVRAGAHRVTGIDGPIGIAVKVEDGNVGVLYAIVRALLDRLEVGTADARSQLDAFRAGPIKNTAGREVGRVAVTLTLTPGRP